MSPTDPRMHLLWQSLPLCFGGSQCPSFSTTSCTHSVFSSWIAVQYEPLALGLCVLQGNCAATSGSTAYLFGMHGVALPPDGPSQGHSGPDDPSGPRTSHQSPQNSLQPQGFRSRHQREHTRGGKEKSGSTVSSGCSHRGNSFPCPGLRERHGADFPTDGCSNSPPSSLGQVTCY